MKKPFFSIITATKNSQNYVLENITSVANQTLKDYEHIFIDGNSTDKTMKIIKKYKTDNPEKVMIFSFLPKGISNAMNEGVKKAKGRYIIHLHADDSFFDEEVLQDVRSYLKNNPGCDWIYGKMCVIEENGRVIGLFPNNWFFQASWGYLLKYCDFIPHQAVFIKREIFKKYGLFDESLSSYMDTEYWLRIRNKTKWKFYNRIISRYMVRPLAQSSGKAKRAENYINHMNVKRRYLNNGELLIMKIFKKVLDKYNTTHR